jgi:hypothetical protein
VYAALSYLVNSTVLQVSAPRGVLSALLLLYYCFFITTALLLLYRHFTTGVCAGARARGMLSASAHVQLGSRYSRQYNVLVVNY